MAYAFKPKTLATEPTYLLHEYGVSAATREVWLEGEVELSMASTFLCNLRLLEARGDEPILVHILSFGGDWYAGMGIYDAIKASPCWITTLSHALAASMSTVIPQAADARLLMPNTDVLVHYGHEFIGGTVQEVQSNAQWSAQLQKRMLDIYVEKCAKGPYFCNPKQNALQVRKWLKDRIESKQDFYMTAQDAVSYGFFDGVLDQSLQSLASG